MRSRVQMALLELRALFAVRFDQAVDTRTCIQKNICRPAENLMEDERAKSQDRRVRGGVIHQLLNQSWLFQQLSFELRFPAGDKHGVLLHVVCVSVVARVAEFPAEEWDHQHGMQEPADSRVDIEIRRERVVAAFVGQNPEAGEEAALDEAVERPERDGDCPWCVELGEQDSGVEQDADGYEVADHVGHGANERALEALCRDSVPHRLDIRHGGRLRRLHDLRRSGGSDCTHSEDSNGLKGGGKGRACRTLQPRPRLLYLLIFPVPRR